MPDKQELLSDVREFLATRPGEAGDILRAVADGLAAYEAAQQKSRNSFASRAISDLVGLYVSPRQKTPPLARLLNAAWHHYPYGRTSHSDVEVKFWNLFLSVARREPLDRAWVEITRGPLCLKWWDEVVAPALRV